MGENTEELLRAILKEMESMKLEMESMKSEIAESVEKSMSKKIDSLKEDFYTVKEQINMVANRPLESVGYIESLNLASAARGESRFVNPYYRR